MVEWLIIRCQLIPITSTRCLIPDRWSTVSQMVHRIWCEQNWILLSCEIHGQLIHPCRAINHYDQRQLGLCVLSPDNQPALTNFLTATDIPYLLFHCSLLFKYTPHYNKKCEIHRFYPTGLLFRDAVQWDVWKQEFSYKFEFEKHQQFKCALKE